MPAMHDLNGRLTFIKEAERLKDVLRSAHTSSGRQESTAEHTWRLCLMALTFADRLGPVDLAEVLKLCVIHDLGEALHGDIPAVDQAGVPDKSDRERQDLQELTGPLPEALRGEFLRLWEDYDQARSPEARVVKALDKLETIIQHNQGANPPQFDYAFNLEYGRTHTSAEPLFAEIRALVDRDTRARLAGGTAP
jgi:putative hydrolase of HD superfamily